MNYASIFKELKASIQLCNNDTRTVTINIKNYFKHKFESEFYVYYHGNGQEFIYDISIFDLDINNIINKNKITLYCAVESELGGKSASSKLSLLKNIKVDFLKLLFSSSKNRIMIASYTKNAKDLIDSPEEFCNQLFNLYLSSDNLNPLLLILIKGEHNLKSNNSRQVKLLIIEENIHGYIFNNNLCNPLV